MRFRPSAVTSRLRPGAPVPQSHALGASVSGVATVAADLVVPGAGGSWALDSQLPVNMTLLDDNPHTALTPSGWGVATRSSQSPAIITDASDPTGDSSIVRQYWGGVPDGQSPHYLYRTTAFNHIFVGTVIRINSQLLPPNEVKWLTWALSTGFSWLGFYGPGVAATYGAPSTNTAGEYEMAYIVRAGGGDLCSQRVNKILIPVDQWFKVQLELRISPVRCRLWINDVLAHTEAGSNLSYPGGISNFGELQHGSTWGGGNGGPVPSGGAIDCARTTIWRT